MHSPEEILTECVKMSKGTIITFTPDPKIGLERKMQLVEDINNQRKEKGEEGTVDLRTFLKWKEPKQEIVATCN